MNEFLLLLLSMSLSGTLLALLLFLLRPLLKRNLSRAWMYYIWCIVALRMLLPFAPRQNLVGSLLADPSAAHAAVIRTIRIYGGYSPCRSALRPGV